MAGQQQPNLGNIATALNTLATEVPLLGNMVGQVAAIQPLLQQIQASQQQMQASQQQILASLQQMQASQQQMHQQLAALGGRLDRLEANMGPRMHNRLCGDDQPLLPLVGANGNLPPGFPATPVALAALVGAAVDALLAAYQLPAGGTLRARRDRLRCFVGR
jgi:chromosome segregation ATPase